MTNDQECGNDGGGGGNDESGWGNHNQNESFKDNNGKISVNTCCRIVVMIIFGIVSVACIIGGAGLLDSSIDKSNNYSETTGIIIGTRSCGQSCSNNNGNNDGCSETFGAIIEYTVNNTTYIIEPSSCSDPPPKIGNDIRVLYDPDDPQEGVDGSWIGLYLAPTILLVIGITTFLSIVVLCCITNRKKFLGKDKPVNTNGAITMIGDSPMITAPSSHVMSSNPKPASFSNTAPHTELVAPTESPYKPDYSTVTPITESPYKPDYSTVTPVAYPVADSNTSGPVSIFDQLKGTTR